MPRLVSLSRAAKLVGLSRGALQKRIHDRELKSFEGQVSLDDIEKLFPDVDIEDNHIIEDLEKIIEQAMQRARGEKLAKLLAPDTQTLAARLQNITKEHARSKKIANDLIQLYSQLENKMNDLAQTSEQAQQIHTLTDWLKESVEKIKSPAPVEAPILEKDTVLRVIAAQVHVKNTGHEFFIEGNNSILEGGLSAGLALNYGCSNGNCGKCKAKLLSGEIKKIKPHDYTFTESEKNQNYFLCCSNTAITEIEIEADEAGNEKDIPQQKITAKVKKISQLSADVLALNLKTPRTKRLRFLAGQNVTLTHPDLPPLELAIASCPCDDMNIQFHISKSSPEKLTQYISNELSTSDSIVVQGPNGSFILDEDSNNTVIFIAYDTGFAPIKSLIEHAVTLEHAEYIYLHWFHTAEQPYMHNQCRAWEDALDNFSYQHQQVNFSEKGLENKELDTLINQYDDLSNKNIYICGEEKMVRQTQQVLLDHHAIEEQIKTQTF